MLSQVFQVMKLRGMDQRWKPESSRARSVKNMRWDPRDGWSRSGGDRSAAQPTSAVESIQPGVAGETTTSSDVEEDPFKTDGQEIVSLHWFAQHNGARQWMIWETAAGQLRAFWGPGISTESATISGRNGYPWLPLIMARSHGSSPEKWNGDERTRTILDTPNIRTQSVSWGGRLYMVNGYDEPIVFDGAKCTRAGYAGGPSAPSASVVRFESLGGNSHFNYWTGDLAYGMGVVGEAGTSKWKPHPDEGDDALEGPLRRGEKWNMWRYRVSFVNERGQESPLSPESNSVRAMAFWEPGIDRYSSGRRDDKVGRRFVSVNIPVGPPGTVARRVYRTQDMLDIRGRPVNLGEGSNYYFCHEIQDNSSKSFEDAIPDSALGTVADEEDYGPWPTNARLLATFKNTMFIAGTSDNVLRFSRPLHPEVFPLNNTIEIGEGEAGPITGMRGTKNALVVFKRKSIYLVKGDPEKGFFAETLTRDVGCCAPNTIAELPGLGTAFLSESGVMLLKGALENTGTATSVVHLSEPIPDLIKEINFSASENACAAYCHKDKEYWLAIPRLSSAENSRVLVYHGAIAEWSYRTGFNIGCMVETRDHRSHLMYGTNSLETENPGIRVYSLGQNSLVGDSAIASEYVTVDHDFGSKFTHFVPAYINAYAVGYGDTKLELNFQVNRSQTYSLTADKTTDQQEGLDLLGVFDKAKWGTDKWGYHRPICLRFDVSAMHEGVLREMAVTFKAQDSMQLVGYDIEGKLGEQRRIRPLTDALGANRR